jgi:plastocyanin
VRKFISLALVVAVLTIVAGAAAACGGDDNGDDGNGGAPTTAATEPANGNDNGDDNGDDGDNDDGELTLIAKNTLWDKTELKAEPGEVTIEVDNQDAGIVHNLHVYAGSDATGEEVGMTELEAGPVKQTLTFTAEPGDYFYVCDAHPATMAGTLTIED